MITTYLNSFGLKKYSVKNAIETYANKYVFQGIIRRSQLVPTQPQDRPGGSHLVPSVYLARFH